MGERERDEEEEERKSAKNRIAHLKSHSMTLLLL
jgi:hypothetical protein